MDGTSNKNTLFSPAAPPPPNKIEEKLSFGIWDFFEN
jgi:hypothetical protein